MIAVQLPDGQEGRVLRAFVRGKSWHRLRDGMNTTSMEFMISQECTKKSPLVHSEYMFMGISYNMSNAMQINPWNLSVRPYLPYMC